MTYAPGQHTFRAMKRLALYVRLQYKLLALLLIVVAPIAVLCLDIIGLSLFSTQALLFGVLMLLRIGHGKLGPEFLQMDLKQYVQRKLKRIPSNKDLAQWQEINREAQDAMFILAGLFILSLKLLVSV